MTHDASVVDVTCCYSDGSIPSSVSESASNSTQSASGNNSTQPAGGDNTTSFAVVQSPFGLFGIFLSSLLAFASGVALVM